MIFDILNWAVKLFGLELYFIELNYFLHSGFLNLICLTNYPALRYFKFKYFQYFIIIDLSMDLNLAIHHHFHFNLKG